MRPTLFVLPLWFVAIGLAGCKKQPTAETSPTIPAPPAKQESSEAYFDVCGLIKKDEIETVQGSPVKDTKSSGRSDGSFHVSQCFYSTVQFSKSVSLALTQANPVYKGKRSPTDFWNETFGSYDQEKEADRTPSNVDAVSADAKLGKEKEEQAAPPRKIECV